MGILMASIGLPLVVTLSYFGIVSFYMVVMFSFGVTMVFVNTPIGVMMQKRIDEEYRGRVFGILETMAMALTPLGMVIFGLLYDIVPAQWVLFGSSTILLLTVLYMLRPSIMKEAHPELEEQAIVKETVEVAS
jgi:MFS transporter, DHA3 family, macrolide efflux protein